MQAHLRRCDCDDEGEGEGEVVGEGNCCSHSHPSDADVSKGCCYQQMLLLLSRMLPLHVRV